MSKFDYIKSLDNIHASESFKANCKQQMLAEKQLRADNGALFLTRKKGMSRRMLIGITVALSLTLFAGAGYAIYWSAFDDAREEAQEAADTPLEERTEQYKTWWDADEDPFWTVLDGAVETDAAVVQLKTLQWYRQDEQRGLFLDVAIKEKRSGLNPLLDGIALVADGLTLERRPEVDGDYVDENGDHIFSYMYNYDGVFEPGIPFTISGQFNIYDPDGNITGTTEPFTLDFTFTREQIEEKIRQEALFMAQFEAEYDQARLDAIDSLPKDVVSVGITKPVGLLADFAADPNKNLLGFGFRSMQGSMEPIIRVDGYQMVADCIYCGDESELMLYRAVLARDNRTLPETSLISFWQSGEVEMAEENCYIFRYNWKTKQVTLPQNEQQEAEWLKEDAANHDAILKKGDTGAFAVKDSQTANGVTATIDKVSFLENGQIRLDYTVDAMYCALMSWESTPKVKINGHDCSCSYPQNYMVEEGIQKAEGKQAVNDFWVFMPTIHYGEIASGEDVTLEITWKLSDLDESLKRFSVGTFRYKIVITKP